MKTFIILVLAVLVMSAAGVSLRHVLSSASDAEENGHEIEKRVSDCTFMVISTYKINTPKRFVILTRFQNGFGWLA